MNLPFVPEDATAPLSPMRYRALIWNFAQRDLKSRFKGTALGWAWSLIVPLATVIIYTVVFSLVFRAQPPDFGSGRTGIFAVWFLAGLVPWNTFVATATGGMAALLNSGHLLQKVFIPAYVPVLGSLVAILTQSAVEFGILFVLLVALGNFAVTWLAFPVWLLIFIIFCAGLSVVLAITNVYMRDLGQITAVVLQLLFFLCPIIYPVSFIPEEAFGLPLRTILLANPVAQFIVMARELIYENTMPGLEQWLYVGAWAGCMVALALWVFGRKGLDVGEAV